VPRELYLRVKAAAASLGMPLGRVVTEALELWLGVTADHRTAELKRQLLDRLSEAAERLEDGLFTKIYRQVLAGRKRCIVAHDVLVKAVAHGDPACAVVVRDLVLGRAGVLTSCLSAAMACDELVKRGLRGAAGSLAVVLPAEAVLPLDWKTLVRAAKEAERLGLDLEPSVIVAQAKLYDISVIISTNDTLDRAGVPRVDPAV